MNTFHPHFGGKPVEPDVKLLMEAFAKPQPGTEISHAAVEAVIECKRGTPRYRTVTTAWRERLFTDDNLRLASKIGEGFRSLLPDERIRDSRGQFKSAARKIESGVKRAAATPPDELNDVDRRRRDHMLLHGAQIERQLRSMRETLPRIPGVKVAAEEGAS